MAKRGQGEGTISKRIVKGEWDGTWWARISVGYDENGKRKRKAFYGKTRKEVQDKLTAALNEINNKTYIEPSKMTVAQWVDIWAKEYKKGFLKTSSYLRIHQYIKNQIIPTLGKYKLNELRNDIVQSWVNQLLEQGLSTGTVIKSYRLLREALEQAVDNSLIKNNVALKVKLPKHVKKESKAFTQEEQDRFIKVAKNASNGAVFLLMLTTGLRIGEALALTWDNIDFDKAELTVTSTASRICDPDDKTSKYHMEMTSAKTASSHRTIPLLPDTVSLLKKVKKEQAERKLLLSNLYVNNNLVFDNKFGRMIDANDALKRFHACCKLADLEGFHPHCLRHTFATRGLEAGIELVVMQKLLGHASIKMTADLYTHVLPNKKKDSMEKLVHIVSI